MYQLHQACFKQLNAVKKVNLCHEAMVTGEISFASQFSNPYATTDCDLSLSQNKRSFEHESSGISFTLALHEIE